MKTSLNEKILSLKGPIFIFGASGFIGANLLDTILKVRNDCFAITHDIRSAWRLKLLQIKPENILFCDINYPNSVTNIFEQYHPQTIFNLSAYGAYSKQQKTNLIYETNIIGTLNILEQCKNISAYIHAGSSSEYGFNSKNPKEKSELLPNSHYSVSKITASYLIQYYGKVYHAPTINLRLYSVYGEWEEPDRLIPRVIEKAREQTFPPLVSPKISRDFLYIKDCVESFIHAAYYMKSEIYGESFNIGTGKKTTIGELVALVQNIFGITKKPEWTTMSPRKWDLEDWYGNYSKAKKFLHWQPTTSLENGLKSYAQWQTSINYNTYVIPAFNNPKNINKISCIIACYKDKQAIPIMYERLVAMFSSLNVNYEIIFVNDASPDNTQEVLEKICEKDYNVVSITHSRNFGSQSAFLSGMEISTGDAVVLMDGDLQDPPEIIPDFYKKWLEGNDVVYGKRVRRETSVIMNVSYKLFYRIFKKLSYITIPLDAGDFSLMDRKVVEQLLSLPEKEVFLRGLRAWVGFKQTGVDYVRPERMFGKSTNNWRKNIWWAKKAIYSFSFVPLEFLSYGGFFLTGISFIAIIIQIISRFLFPDIPHGIPTIIVLILFFGGIQMLSVSIIGEYLSKIFEETKGRPKFIRTSVIHRGRKLESASEIENMIKTVN